MNAHLSIALTSLFFISQILAAEPTPYPVRDIDPESQKFEKIYQTTADQIHNAALARLKVYNIKVLQTISNGFYRVKVGDTTYAMKIPGKPIADDEIVELPAVETSDVYQYTTVLGSTASIKVAVIPDLPKKMSKETFLATLEQGKTYEVQIGEIRKNCGNCGGFGKASGLTDERCRRCGGRGVFITPKLFLIQW